MWSSKNVQKSSLQISAPFSPQSFLLRLWSPAAGSRSPKGADRPLPCLPVLHLMECFGDSGGVVYLGKNRCYVHQQVAVSISFAFLMGTYEGHLSHLLFQLLCTFNQPAVLPINDCIRRSRFFPCPIRRQSHNLKERGQHVGKVAVIFL